MRLHAEREGDGPPIVLVHGFAQTGRCWGPEADALEADHQVVRVDAPGHGRSAFADADLSAGARLIGEAGGPATYLGYSMGARLCLHLALDQPDLVRGLVLIGATAGIEDPQARVARREEDARTAARIRAEGVAEFLDAWLTQPLFASLPDHAHFRTERLENTAEGLASSIEHAGTGSQAPLWDTLSQLTMPVLVVAGALDEKFSALARRLVATVGDNATLAIVPNAGHAVHLEQPDALMSVLRPWLAQHAL